MPSTSHSEKKISVLQFVNTLEFGGATDYALTLCENIDSQVFETRFATGPGSGWEARAEQCNEHVLALDTMKPTHTDESDNTVWGDLVALWRLYRYLRQHDIQVIHSHGSKSRLIGGLASWLARTPVRIHSAHGFAFNSRMPKWKFSVFLVLEKLMGLLHHELVLESQHDLEEARRHQLSKNSLCIYTGILFQDKTDDTTIAELRNSLGVTDEVLVLMVGRLTEQKDPHTFVKSAQLVNEKSESTVFAVVGDGDLFDSTSELVPDKGRVKLLGRRTDAKRLIDACDIYMLTSRWEGIPLTILAAMASGKPIVATNKLGLPEVVIDGKTGLLAEEGNPDDYAAAVMKLVDDQKLRDELGAAGCDLVRQRHDMTAMISEFEALYKQSYH